MPAIAGRSFLKYESRHKDGSLGLVTTSNQFLTNADGGGAFLLAAGLPASDL